MTPSGDAAFTNTKQRLQTPGGDTRGGASEWIEMKEKAGAADHVQEVEEVTGV